MTYDINTHRRSEIEHDVHLVFDGGPGWDAYVRAKAKRLAKEDPGLFGDLPKAVEQAIAARAAKPEKT